MNDVVYFCPTCNSPNVTYSALAGGNAQCNGCGWKGQKEDLVAAPFQNEQGSPEELIKVFGRQLLLSMAQTFAMPFARMLSDWGFITQDNPQRVERYLRVSAAAVLKAVFEERIKIEQEEIVAQGKVGKA